MTTKKKHHIITQIQIVRELCSANLCQGGLSSWLGDFVIIYNMFTFSPRHPTCVQIFIKKNGQIVEKLGTKKHSAFAKVMKPYDSLRYSSCL